MLRTTASTAVVANDRGSQAAAAHPRPAPATMARGPLKGDAPMTDSLTATGDDDDDDDFASNGRAREASPAAYLDLHGGDSFERRRGDPMD